MSILTSRPREAALGGTVGVRLGWWACELKKNPPDMIKEVEIAAGAAAAGVGLTLFLGLPPQWWPDISSYTIHAGILFGVILFTFGFVVLMVGCCRYASDHRVCGRLTRVWNKMWTIRRVVVAAVLSMALVAFGPLLWHESQKW